MENGAGGSRGNAAPACFCVTYVDGVRVLIPDNVGLVAQAGGFTFPADEAQRAAVNVARQVDHYRRVRRQARRMPELAAVVGGEDALVDLIYGDIDEFGRVLEGAPITPGVYATYVPN